jgi:hypothetical protein
MFVSVDYVKTVPHLCHPEVQISHMPSEFMRLECNELLELVGEDCCDVGKISYRKNPQASMGRSGSSISSSASRTFPGRSSPSTPRWKSRDSESGRETPVRLS